MYFDKIAKNIFNNILKEMNLDTNHKIVIDLYNINLDFDLATNIALICSKNAKKPPMILGQEICEKLLSYKEIEKVELAKPGFINFQFKNFVYFDFYKSIYETPIKNIIKENLENKKQNIALEFVSANPTGYLHIGHARQAIIGDTIASILNYVGNNVKTQYYINDAGKQMEILVTSVFARYLELITNKPHIEQLEDKYGGEEIIILAKKIHSNIKDKYKHTSIENNKINNPETYSYFLQISYEYFMQEIKNDLKLLDVSIEEYIKESSFIKEIPSMLQDLKKNGYLYDFEGAQFLASTKKGDDKDRVLIKSDKTFTYVVPDICLHRWKFMQNYDEIIDILGADHHGYTKRLSSTMSMLGFDDSKLKFIISQLVKLSENGQEVKMSKRKGTSIWLKELVNLVGKDSARFLMISNLTTTTLDFDLSKAKETTNENPVFYCKYALARCKQILKNAEIKNINYKDSNYFKNFFEHGLFSDKEKKLFLVISELDKTIKLSIESLEPYTLIRYLVNFVKLFHSYYNETKIIQEDNINNSIFKLKMIEIIIKFLEEIFFILKIETIDRM